MEQEVKQLLEYSQSLEDALQRILKQGRLDVVKEIAADALGEDLEEELEELDFMDDEFDGDMDYSLIDAEG